MPFMRKRYPANWEAISRRIRYERAGNRCEWPGCGLENHQVTQGKRGPYKVVLTVAHLDHDTTNNDEENLAAWCQPHHLRYDAQHHAQRAAATRAAKRQEAQSYGR